MFDSTVRSILHFAARGLRGPAPRLVSALGQTPATLFYHVVSDERLPHVAPLFRYKGTARFAADLEWLCRRFRPVSVADVADHVHGRRTLPRRACLLSFDDGLRECADVIAPMLKARGIPAVFFVSSAFIDNRRMFYRHKAALILDRFATGRPVAWGVAGLLALVAADADAAIDPEAEVRAVTYANDPLLDRIARAMDLDIPGYLRDRQPYLTSEQIDGLAADGFEIGAHSETHPWYQEIPVAAQIEETVRSVAFVARRWPSASPAFAFPFNDLGVPLDVFTALRDAGAAVSFGSAGLRRDSLSWSLQRIAADDPAVPLSEAIARSVVKFAVQMAFGRATIARVPAAPDSYAAAASGAATVMNLPSSVPAGR